MNPIKATWSQGQIHLAGPVDWPEGSELVVEPVAVLGEKVGMEESQWRNDPAALAEWESWLMTIEPLLLTDEERTQFAQYEEESRRYNLEAVKRQMAVEEQP